MHKLLKFDVLLHETLFSRYIKLYIIGIQYASKTLNIILLIMKTLIYNLQITQIHGLLIHETLTLKI